MKIRLTDAQKMHNQHPMSFEVPSYDEIMAVKEGSEVKLGFSMSPPGGRAITERMWVNVKKKLPKNNKIVFEGEIDNDPITLPLKLGQKIIFGPENIMGVWRD